MNRIGCILAGCVVIGLAPPARAYRPFDGTDADVAGAGEVELELGPVEVSRSASRSTWIAPAMIFNYGVVRDFELVIEGRHQIERPVDTSAVHSVLTDSAISIKEVLQDGCLQGHPGISIANEWSVLFADTGSRQSLGAELTTIFSVRWRLSTLHLNVYNELTRQGHFAGSIGPIIEGPYTWPVRPVMELIATREFGSARLNQGLFGSTLIGMIGRLGKDLSLDCAVLYAKSHDVREEAFRAGFTWSFDTGF